jgi:hypothetical protein
MQSSSDRKTLLQGILNAASIPAQAFQGHPIYYFDVYERTGWAKGRQTKRAEDMAYSLMGLCDVQIALIYGEGKKNALRRLQKAIAEITAD